MTEECSSIARMLEESESSCSTFEELMRRVEEKYTQTPSLHRTKSALNYWRENRAVPVMPGESRLLNMEPSAESLCDKDLAHSIRSIEIPSSNSHDIIQEAEEIREAYNREIGEQQRELKNELVTPFYVINCTEVYTDTREEVERDWSDAE